LLYKFILLLMNYYDFMLKSVQFVDINYNYLLYKLILFSDKHRHTSMFNREGAALAVASFVGSYPSKTHKTLNLITMYIVVSS
jgi:hypothetical protein